MSGPGFVSVHSMDLITALAILSEGWLGLVGAGLCTSNSERQGGRPITITISHILQQKGLASPAETRFRETACFPASV